MNYKEILINILVWIVISFLSLLTIKIYQYFAITNFYPAIEVIISYSLYKSKNNKIIICIYLFFVDLLYSNLIFSSIICFIASYKLVILFEREENEVLIEKIIKISLYTLSFLTLRYLLFCIYQKNLYSATSYLIQVFATILFYPIIEYILRFKKLGRQNV
jgi:hypothetical protein